jgi:hypothetical protein
LDFLECVAEPARFNRSTGRIGFGVKEQDHVLAAIVLQGNCFSLFISKRELRGFIINFHGFSVFIKSMNLYSRRAFLASMLVVLVCAGLLTSSVAQRRKTHKLRATAVVEVTTDSSGKVTTRVVPVTVLDEGQFQDASIYKATPRPMALENGIVYEAQTSGIPVANTTILSGANSNGWTALGRWQIVTAAPKKSDTPPPVVTSNDRPTLHRRAEGGSTDSSASAPSGSPGSSPSNSSDDRPTLHRPSDSSPSASGTPSPSATPTPNPSSTSDDRPTLHRPTESAPSASPSPTPSATSQTTTSQSTADNSQSNSAPSAQAEDPDRPTLRRRNSAEQGPPPSQSSQSKPTQVETSAPAIKTPATAPGTTKSFAAVSDTTPTDIRSFDFQWKPGEAEPMELKMRKLALAQIPKEHTQVQVTKEETQLTVKSLKNVVMRSFDLDLSNDAVIVLSAEIPATVPSTKESSAKFISRYVTVIARVDFDGEPQKVLASVTDSSRLDVTPRLELIDAVDVDGDGIAELLFRQYGYDEKSFVIYSVGRSTATKLFEGASRSLR